MGFDIDNAEIMLLFGHGNYEYNIYTPSHPFQEKKDISSPFWISNSERKMPNILKSRDIINDMEEEFNLDPEVDLDSDFKKILNTQGGNFCTLPDNIAVINPIALGTLGLLDFQTNDVITYIQKNEQSIKARLQSDKYINTFLSTELSSDNTNYVNSFGYLSPMSKKEIAKTQGCPLTGNSSFNIPGSTTLNKLISPFDEYDEHDEESQEYSWLCGAVNVAQMKQIPKVVLQKEKKIGSLFYEEDLDDLPRNENTEDRLNRILGHKDEKPLGFYSGCPMVDKLYKYSAKHMRSISLFQIVNAINYCFSKKNIILITMNCSPLFVCGRPSKYILDENTKEIESTYTKIRYMVQVEKTNYVRKRKRARRIQNDNVGEVIESSIQNYQYFIVFEYLKQFVEDRNNQWRNVFVNHTKQRNRERECQMPQCLLTSYKDNDMGSLYDYGKIFYTKENMEILKDYFTNLIINNNKNNTWDDSFELTNSKIMGIMENIQKN